MPDVIVTAGTVITMDPENPRAEAVVVTGDRIAAVGSLADCRAASPGAEVIDSGAAALLPGFVEPHGHPVVSGVVTQWPARSIAPWDAPTWPDVEKQFTEALEHSDPGTPLWFAGFDALLHRRPSPKAPELDRIFGDREVIITDNSGHGIYFNTALMKRRGWDVDPPADPVAAKFGRNPDGSLDGQGFELPVVLEVAGPLMAQMGNPLVSAAKYYSLMAQGGYTSTSDMTYARHVKGAYEALAAAPSCPLRVSMWEVSTSEQYTEPESFAAGDAMLTKQGVKLWTDGSPWVGNIAISYPYLSTEATRTAGIDPSVAGGVRSMNYTRDQLDAILDRAAPLGWQMAFHANGDLAIDLALDAYEAALSRHGLAGADHRWRLEHVGGGTRRQFDRAANLGVYVSMAPFQYYYWGDLLDGQMFDHEHGSRWQSFADAVASGACISLHNDGAVSQPTPVLNVATAVTRRTREGNVHAADQTISLDAALRAQTIDAARTLHRESLVGSITPGKLADFTELNADPYAVDPVALVDSARVSGTWLGGRRVELGSFMAAIGNTDSSRHAHLASGSRMSGCC